MVLKNTRLLLLSPFAYLVCAMGLLLNATTCAAMSRMYDAQVLDKDGIPCFTVQEDHQKDAPKLSSIDVLDISQRASRMMWDQFSIQQDRVPFLFSAAVCLLYGTPFENTGESSNPKKLEVGKSYRVDISAFVPKGEGSENRNYRARFCLSRTESGGVKVHQVIYNKGWRYEVCQP